MIKINLPSGTPEPQPQPHHKKKEEEEVEEPVHIWLPQVYLGYSTSVR